MDKLDNETMRVLGMMMGSDAILTQEKHGQGQVVMNEVLPIECDKPAFESLGFVFGDKVDSLFYNVRFPDGWKREATDHSMWTDIVDGKGRKRGSIGYKAAFYDRWAQARLNRRFGIAKRDTEGGFLSWGSVGYSCVIDHDGTELFKTGEFLEDLGNRDVSEKAKKQCAQWLQDNYPDHESPLAYWD